MKHFTISLLAVILLLSCKQKLPNDAALVSQSFDRLNVVDTDKEIALN